MIVLFLPLYDRLDNSSMYIALVTSLNDDLGNIILGEIN